MGSLPVPQPMGTRRLARRRLHSSAATTRLPGLVAPGARRDPSRRRHLLADHPIDPAIQSEGPEPTDPDDDDAAGTLEAALSGDLEGMSRWTISRSGPATLAVFDEDVVARKALIRTLGPVARPAFRANHAVMMAAGKRGLVAYLAGMRLGRSLPVPP